MLYHCKGSLLNQKKIKKAESNLGCDDNLSDKDPKLWALNPLPWCRISTFLFQPNTNFFDICFGYRFNSKLKFFLISVIDFERSLSMGSRANRVGERWNQMGCEEKSSVIQEEIKRVSKLPSNSVYAVHRLKVLNKINELLSVQVSKELNIWMDSK